MANICCNKYAFYSNDESTDELKRFHKNLSAIMETPTKDSTIGLDLVVTMHGLDCNKIACKGTIDNLGDYSPESNFFTLNSDTAWAPTEGLWKVVTAQYKGVSFVYIAEECGANIYVNTDAEGLYLPERYLLEICGDALIPDGWYANQEKPDYLDIRDYFNNFDDLMDYCTELTGKNFDTLKELQVYISDHFDEEANTIAKVIEFTDE